MSAITCRFSCPRPVTGFSWIAPIAALSILAKAIRKEPRSTLNCQLLSRGQDSLGAGKGRTGASVRAAAREGKGDRDFGSWGASPPVRETGRVVPLVPRSGLTVSVPGKRHARRALPTILRQCCGRVAPGIGTSYDWVQNTRLIPPAECDGGAR